MDESADGLQPLVELDITDTPNLQSRKRSEKLERGKKFDHQHRAKVQVQLNSGGMGRVHISRSTDIVFALGRDLPPAMLRQQPSIS